MKFLLKINCTTNNTTFTLLNKKLKTLTTISAGTVGFKKARRSSKQATEKIVLQLKEYLKKFKKPYRFILFYKGVGKNRKIIRYYLKQKKIIIHKIVNESHIPHNGCRAKRQRQP